MVVGAIKLRMPGVNKSTFISHANDKQNKKEKSGAKIIQVIRHDLLLARFQA